MACHLQAQNAGLRSRDLLKVAGVKCSLVQRCSGIDGTWGYRAENYELARKVAAPLGREIQAAGNEVVCGDCHLANGSILQETGTQPVHPMQLLARAYGLGRGAPVTEPVAGRGRRPLTLDDVLDLRAYERVRDDYRARVIARKRHRRVALGPIMTLVFECVDTVRFQVQEMARVEKIISDEAIQVELDIYNRLLPGAGRAVGHPVHRADLGRSAAGVAAPAGGDRAARLRGRQVGTGTWCPACPRPSTPPP